MHKFSQTLQKDVKEVWSTVQQMRKCNFFNASHVDDNLKQMTLATVRFLLDSDGLRNLCFRPQNASKCQASPNAKTKTWKKVKSFDLCRMRCNAQSVDTSSFCCMHTGRSASCQLIWVSNSTIPAPLSDRATSTICQPMPVLNIIGEMRILVALALAVLRD